MILMDEAKESNNKPQQSTTKRDRWVYFIVRQVWDQGPFY